MNDLISQRCLNLASLPRLILHKQGFLKPIRMTFPVTYGPQASLPSSRGNRRRLLSCGILVQLMSRAGREMSCDHRRLLGFETGRRPKNANLGDQRGLESESDSESEDSWSKTLMWGDFGVGLLSCGQDACAFPRCS